MKRAVLRVALLVFPLFAGPALLGGDTHLGVPAKQITKIVFNQIYDPSTSTVTTVWAEWINGSYTSAGPTAFVVPKDRTLIITDMDMTIRCNAAVPNPPSITMLVNVLDPGTNLIQILNRFIPARQVPGNEEQHATIFAGHVVPGGFQLSVDPIDPTALPSHWIRRVALNGYYVK